MPTAGRPLSSHEPSHEPRRKPSREPSPEPLELIPDHPRSWAGAPGSAGIGWVSAAADGHDPATVLAAFLVVLYKYTGQRDLLLDVQLDGWSGALSVSVD